MDSVKPSAVTPTKSRFASTLAKVFHIQAATPDDGIQKTKSQEKTKKGQLKPKKLDGDEDEELQNMIITEAWLAKLFAGLSSIKAAYAQLQFAQSPYDADGIQSADQIVVFELKNLSELKQCYLKKQLNETSPETTLLLSEIQEQKSLLKIYEITGKKLDSQLKLRNSDVTFLKEKLAEAVNDNKSIQKKLNASAQLVMPDNIQLSDLKPSHFISYFRSALKSIRSFVHLLISEMESAHWDLEAAANAIEPGISFWKPNHKCFAIESFVCKQMFDGFSFRKAEKELFFNRFTELKSAGPADYLAWKPKSEFAAFCREKYSRVVHPKMERLIFGNVDQGNLVGSGNFPETAFFAAFSEMAKRVWLLNCLALCFETEVSVYQVSKGSRFSEVHMESLSDEAFLPSSDVETDPPRVAFTVVPGFRIGKIIIVQCQVYLI